MAARRWVSLALVLAVGAAWINIFATGEPKLPSKSADGTYFNPCCGLIRLHNGELKSGRDTIPYVIEIDKGGAYVLPKGLVSVASNRLDIDRTASPLKMRLDRPSSPTRIEIMDRSDAPSHIFERQTGS